MMKLSLILTHDCNLRCRYCYTGQKSARFMPMAVASRALELGCELARDDALFVSLFGGEPLLDIEQVERVIEEARAVTSRHRKALLLSVSTNGTLLDEVRLRLLRRAGVHVQLSLDGDREAHDLNRRFVDGRSSYAAVSAAVPALRAAQIPFTVVAVVTPGTARGLGRSLAAMVELGATRISFSPEVRTRWDDAACGDFEAGVRDLADVAMSLLAAGRDVCVEPLHAKIMTRVVPGDRQPVLCTFGVHEIAVSPAGRLYPCDRLVREDDDARVCIGDVATGIDAVRRDRLLTSRNATDPECAGCSLRTRCRHFCGCVNLDSSGDPARPSPLVCWMERCFITEADRIAATLYARGAPQFLHRYYGARG